MRRVLLGNFTICGPALSKFLMEHPHDAALAAEMHLPLTQVSGWAATFGGMGWIIDWAPSQEVLAPTEGQKARAAEAAPAVRTRMRGKTPPGLRAAGLAAQAPRRVRGKAPPKPQQNSDRLRRTGGERGTMSMVQAHCASEALDALAQLRSSGDVVDLSGFCWHLRGDSLVMMCGYCRPSIGFAGPNRERLQSWAAFLATLTVPWILFADWNMEPEELRSSGWLQTLGIEVDILSPNIAETSTAGGGELHEYIVCSVTALPALGEFEWLPQGVWSSNLVFSLAVWSRPKFVQGPQLARPLPLPRGPIDKRVQNPWSKASRVKARSAAKKALASLQRPGVAHEKQSEAQAIDGAAVAMEGVAIPLPWPQTTSQGEDALLDGGAVEENMEFEFGEEVPAGFFDDIEFLNASNQLAKAGAVAPYDLYRVGIPLPADEAGARDHRGWSTS